MTDAARHARDHRPSEAGFSLAELTVSMAVLLIVSNLVFTGILRLSNVNVSVHNRSEMHSGVRNATELLQQEVGQAGRVTLPGPVTLTAAVAAGTATVGVSSAAGMFVGERLVIGTGANEETVTLTGVDPDGDTITATFVGTHTAGTPVLVHGGFASGVVPTSMSDGSSDSVLKIYGDVDGDGNMRYVEYTCDTAGGNLYRNTMPFDADAKPVVTVAEVLLNNILPNPDGTPCFTYQEKTVSGTDFVVQVAITLTVQTGEPDPITGLFQTETKALLNVSPRNVFHVWQLASLGITNRVQPMPAAALLADE
jgi:type II secretory pathway pseudopilin PulG